MQLLQIADAGVYGTLWYAIVAVGAVLGLVVGAMFLRRGRNRMNLLLAGVMTAGALWGTSEFLHQATGAGSPEVFVNQFKYVWIPATTVGWLLFGLEYSEYGEYVNWKTAGVLALHPVVVGAAAFTNPAHQLVWASSGGNGPVWIAHALLAYVELMAGTVLILRQLYRDESIYRRQAVLLAFGILFPTFFNAPYILGLIDTPGDPTPAGFAVTGLAFFWGMRSYDLGDVTPIAKSVVVDNLTDGLIIVDENDRITEINDEGREMLRIPDARVGQPLDAAVEHAPEIVELGQADESIHVEVDVELPSDPGADLATDGGTGERRTFEFEVTPVRGKHDSIVGRLYQFRDVTERVERERELELQNQQLDNFVAAISRDIREPMDQLDEQLTWAFEHAPETEQQLRRVLYASTQTVDEVGTTLEELVELARDRSVVREEDMGRVSLENVADEAWYEATGREGPATLSGVADASVYADGDRLQRILEHLFDNAVVHGGEDVDVEVGIVDDENGRDGFYVEDDGPGFSPTDEDPFSPGITTADDRPGVGLAVVSTGVEAHGWDVEATGGADGGARIEVTDVDFPDTRLSDQVGALATTDAVVDDPELGAD